MNCWVETSGSFFRLFCVWLLVKMALKSKKFPPKLCRVNECYLDHQIPKCLQINQRNNTPQSSLTSSQWTYVAIISTSSTHLDKEKKYFFMIFKVAICLDTYNSCILFSPLFYLTDTTSNWNHTIQTISHQQWKIWCTWSPRPDSVKRIPDWEYRAHMVVNATTHRWAWTGVIWCVVAEAIAHKRSLW